MQIRWNYRFYSDSRSLEKMKGANRPARLQNPGKLSRDCLSFWGILSALFLVTACISGPNYIKPMLETPAAFKELEGWKLAQPQDEEIRGKWWEIFQDAQLNELEEQVNLSNQNLAIAEAQFRQARALVQSARAGYYPTVAVAPSDTRTHRSANLSSGAFSRSDSSTYSLPAEVSWEIDIWGRVRRIVESNQANVQASAADLELIRLSIQAELAQNYIQLRALDSQKQLLDETLLAYKKSLELTKNRYAKGVVSRADVLMAETQLKTTQAQAIDIGVQRAQFEHAIAALVGKPASDFAIPVAPLAIKSPSIPIGIPSDLLERRPDIAVAERRVAAANAQIGVAKAAYYPRITLSASGGFQSSNASDWFSWPSHFWSLGPALLETVFDGGARKALNDQARAEYEATVAAYRQTAINAFKEVEDNLAALRILEEEAKVQEEAVQAAEQSLSVITNRYKAGMVSYLDVIVVQTSTLNNERTAVQILSRRLNAGVLLIKALGGGWKTSDSVFTLQETLYKGKNGIHENGGE